MQRPRNSNATRPNKNERRRRAWNCTVGATTTCLCAAATALCCLDATTTTTHALVVNSHAAVTIPRSGNLGAGSTNAWRGFGDAQRARSADSWQSSDAAVGSYRCADSGAGGAQRVGDALGIGQRSCRRRKGGYALGAAKAMRRGVGCSMLSGGVWALQDEEEWEFEDEVQRLEKRLEKAVKKEDYDRAAKARDKLYRIHMDETSAVLSTNSAFYAAFTAKDPDRMASLWLPSNDVMCVHPGDEPISGHMAVSRSWRSLFSTGDGRFSASIIKPTDVKIRVRGTTAIVQCCEEVTTGGDGGPHQSAASWLSAMKAEMGSRAGAVAGVEGDAGDGASPAKAQGAAASAAAAAEGTKEKRKRRYLNVTNIYRKAGGRWLMVHHHASLPPPPQSSKDQRAAMGMGGLQLGEGDGMSRIINLSDQSFNGANMDGKLEEMLESLRSQLPGTGSFSLGGPSSTGRLQQSMLVIGESDDDDDDDEEEDDNAVEISIDAGRGEWRWGGGTPLTEDLTKKTMQTLSTLGRDKMLGRREQRRLITDVIQHANGDEASAVEVAYELLLAHKNEDLKDQASLGEFVEQCKLLASSLFEDDRSNGRRRWRKNNN